ncbi:MAG: FAD-dependent oxidoreductase [Synechococcales bacterium]|nr:FAD-dependent oxidoreductase [Synechococcales bacterium]
MRVVIVGAGIVGAAIAYELSQIPEFHITVLDRDMGRVRSDATHYNGATGAALGVLMAAISKKEKGRNLQMRLAGVDWYDRVIPQLEAQTGLSIPVNHQGILMLQFAEEERAVWQRLIEIRQARQGRVLEWWDADRLAEACPQVNLATVIGAVYSPSDRQIHPAALTQALITAAQLNGVLFQFGVTATQILADQVRWQDGAIGFDQLIVAAGIGSDGLSDVALEIRPVLGQAIHLRSPHPLGKVDFQPVLTGHDIHLVPLNARDFWLGATVEFPSDDQPTSMPVADPQQFEQLMAGAIALFPEVAQAERIRHWQGLRPRPSGRPAPVIERSPHQSNVIFATGHYRNGVLLAPATALQVRSMLTDVATKIFCANAHDVAFW